MRWLSLIHGGETRLVGKHQNPNTKHQRSSKLQNNRAGLIQSFGIWKFLGVWILVFGVSLRLVRHFDHVAVAQRLWSAAA
jgi:hypothetical protein